MNTSILGRLLSGVVGALASAVLLAGLARSARGAPDVAQASAWSPAESLRYKRTWGVDVEGVKAVESGYMLAFRYRVLDADKARPLNDQKTRPFIIDEASDVRLSVPAMEKVGELRQVGEPEAGRTYFIIFGNPGKLVKPGRRVTVAIGNFRVEGLVVK